MKRQWFHEPCHIADIRNPMVCMAGGGRIPRPSVAIRDHAVLAVTLFDLSPIYLSEGRNGAGRSWNEVLGPSREISSQLVRGRAPCEVEAYMSQVMEV
jgi:hypothetical protein